MFFLSPKLVTPVCLLEVDLKKGCCDEIVGVEGNSDKEHNESLFSQVGILFHNDKSTFTGLIVYNLTFQF